MKHAREDYNRIQDPAKLIGEDEPVFLLRGKDVTTPDTIRGWCILQEQIGNPDTEIVRIAREWADTVQDWQEKHGCKMADI